MLEIAGLYPNPAVNSLQLDIKTPADKQVLLMITDATGKIMMQKSMDLTAGENKMLVPIAAYASGLYFITIKDKATPNSITARFVK